MPTSDIYPEAITVHLNGHHHRQVWMRGYEGDTKAKRALVRCSLTDLSGTGVFDMSTGYGVTKGLLDWKLTEDSQTALLEWGALHGHTCSRKARPQRRALTRRKRKVDKRQGEMFP